MTVLHFATAGTFRGERITFIRVSMTGGWHLLGMTPDKSKRIAIFDKDDTFGIIEEKQTETYQ